MGTTVRRYLPIALGLALLGSFLPLGSPPAVRAAGTINLSAANVPYTEDFDTLASSGTSDSVPNGWWFSETGTSANALYAAGTGSSNAGDTYSFGAASDSDRAFGGLQSGAVVPTIGASFSNDTGETIVTLAIEYDCEMWRAGVTNRGAADRMDFQYSLDATALTNGTWTDVDPLDCHSANINTTSGAKDGNASEFRTVVAHSITGLAIAAGSSFWLRWASFDIAPGADDGLAVDNFELVPNPTAMTSPSGVGAADPSTVAPTEQSLLTVTVTPGMNPTSTGLSVSADLTAIGGLANQAFADDGLGADDTAGDNVFSYLATVDGATTDGSKSLPFSISDAESRTGSGQITLNVATAQVGSDIVISEFRFRGPAGGNDEFVELYNRSDDPIDISGWLLRGSNASAGVSTRATVAPSTVLDPGCYYLFTNTAANGYTGAAPGDQSYTIGIVDNGGVAIALPDMTLVDQVGLSAGSAYGEGTRLADLGSSNQNRSYERLPGGTDGGQQDTDDNFADFQLITPSNPQNSDSHCVGAPTAPTGDGSANPFTVVRGASTLLTVAVTPGTDPASTGLTVVGDLTAIGGSATQSFFDDGTNGDAVIGDNVFSYSAMVDSGTSAGFKSIPFTVSDAETRSTNDAILMAVVGQCGDSFTTTYTLQGSGAATTMSGFQETEAVVIGNYQGGPGTLRGIFIQDPLGDGDPLTSDGLFVFNGGPTETLAVGDRVRVSGDIEEFQGQTQISSVDIHACSSGHDIAPTNVNLPVPAPDGGVDYLERVEGMLVRFNQTLYVTEHFQLGRFGQVTMSSGGRLQQPTAVVEPGAPANAMQAANNLNRIIVDDDSQAQNPDPILFGRSGAPLSASNTLRGGDTAADITGVMTWTWAGNAASGNNWRIRPVSSMHGGVPDFQPANPRPETRPDVGGTVQVGSLNVLNYFNTFSACSNGVGGAPANSNCRGANNQAEFDRQWPKTVAAIVGMDVDVIGIMEIENDGYGPDSALAHLVDRLNAATAPGTYAFIDPDAATLQLNSLGTDGIRVALIYRPADVTPVGTTAVLNTEEFVNGGDSVPRSRPSLAQAFEINDNGGVFVVDVNHFKSKSGTCDDGDAGADGDGGCNAVRAAAAEELVDWLATDPTGSGSPDVLIVGDLNAYAMEDPIDVLEDAGYTNLVRTFNGLDAYSYVFDGQWGYLDHALGSPSATSRVTGVVEWHINADEPAVLDYNTEFKSAGQLFSLYEPDQYRMSDHDPVIVGLDYSNAFAKGEVLAALEQLLAETTDEKAAKRIAKAIERLEKSLTPDWWIGGDQLSLSEGQKVFSEEKKVVQELTKKELADNPVAQQLVQAILDIDRALALAEIERAEAAGGKAKDIEKAYAELDKGDARRDDGKFAQAVDSWKHAWEKARNAQK